VDGLAITPPAAGLTPALRRFIAGPAVGDALGEPPLIGFGVSCGRLFTRYWLREEKTRLGKPTVAQGDGRDGK